VVDFIGETCLNLLRVFHTVTVLRAARCRTFPDGLFSVYCSQPRGCAFSTTSSSICFNINGPILSQTPRDSGDLLGSSTVGMAAGEALTAAGCGCQLSLTTIPWWSAAWSSSLELRPRAPSTAMFGSHTLLPKTSDIPLILGIKNRINCFSGKKIVTSKRREWTSPPQWDHYGILIRWPINRSNRFSDFLRLDRFG